MALSHQLLAIALAYLLLSNPPSLSLYLFVFAARLVGAEDCWQHVGPATCLVMPAPRRLHGHCGRPHHAPHAQGHAEWQGATGAGKLQQLLLLLVVPQRLH